MLLTIPEKGREREGGDAAEAKQEGKEGGKCLFVPLTFPSQPYFPHFPLGKEATAEKQRDLLMVNSQL